MSVAFLMLTTQCNRSCAYCFYETGYQVRGDPSARLSVDTRLLHALRKAGVDKVILSGGEPLLLPDIVEVVQKITDEGFFPLLLTNGELLTRALLDKLDDAGLAAISLSLDSMAGGGDAKAPWQALEYVSAHESLQSAVITPVTRLNVGRVGEIVTRVYNSGSYALIQPVFIPESHPLHDKLSLEQCTPAEKRLFKQAIETWVNLFGNCTYAELLLDYYENRDTRPPTCSMGTTSVVIEADGEVYPCFHRRDLCAGNIVASDPVAVLRKAFQFGPTLSQAPCFGEHCISLFSHLE